mgnify:CR=1 FL=1
MNIDDLARGVRGVRGGVFVLYMSDERCVLYVYLHIMHRMQL